MARRPATLRIDIIGNARKAQAALRDVDKGFGRLAGKVRNHAAAIAAGFGALTAGAVGAAKAAAAEESAQVRLATAMRNNVGATQAQIDATEAWIDTIKIGSIQSDDTLRPALGRLVTTTQNLTSAQALLAVSMDVAAATGKPLEAVTTAVAKAAGGQTGALTRLIPGLDVSAIKTGDLSTLTGTLAKRFGGADAAASSTAEGGLQDFSDATSDAYEAIGKELLPAVKDFTDWATSPEGKDSIEDIAKAVGSIAAAIRDVVDLAGDVDDFIDKLRELNDTVEGWIGWPDAGVEWPWNRSAATYTGSAAGGLATARAYPGAGPAPVAAARRAMYGPNFRTPARVTEINVSGALDPVAVAAQIRSILATDDRRNGVRR